MSIFQTIGNAISNFFKKEVPVVENAFNSAKAAVNVLKTFAGSATGQTVEAIIEALFPGTGTAIIGALNVFFTDFGLVVAETNKNAADVTADGLNAIAKLSGNSQITALSNVASIIGDAASNANGGNSTLQQAIVALPLVYNPTLLNSVGSEITNSPETNVTPGYSLSVDPNQSLGGSILDPNATQV